MPDWLSIMLGIVAGFATIAGAFYLAIRPYLNPAYKSRLPPSQDGKYDDPSEARALHNSVINNP